MSHASDYAPFRIGQRLRVVPPGTGAVEGRVDLVLARGAFGSGEHETTSSCLELIESLPGLDEASVLDLGAGTGILGLAALALGARHAVLVDNDTAAVEAARLHLALNGLGDRATVVQGELATLRETSFDLLLANLHADILLAVGKDLVARARPGARLVLSGILWEHNWDVRRLYRQLGCKLLQNRFLDEYSTLLLEATFLEATSTSLFERP